MKKLLTWLDVERIIRKETNNYANLPEGVVRIDCFSEAVEFGLKAMAEVNNAISALKSWFGEWFKDDTHQINLDINDATIAVEFFPDEPADQRSRVPKPLWQDVAYLRNIESNTDEPNWEIIFPEPFTTPPSVTAFHSFKGGVGRTTVLACYLFALLKKVESAKPFRCLLVDADLEAPGMTFWLNERENKPSVSFIDYLEAIHYPPSNQRNVIRFFANELRKTSFSYGGSEIYILPAFTDEKQLLDTPVLPEHIARGPNGPWFCGDVIHALGKELKTEFILVDLRAGLSEISGPLLFDPRVERLLVTTVAEQAVKGTTLVLKLISKMMSKIQGLSKMAAAKPSLIISMLTPDLRGSTSYERALTELEGAYDLADETNADLSSSQLSEAFFEPSLMSIANWDEARSRLKDAAMLDIAEEWVERKISEQVTDKKINPEEVKKMIQDILTICEKYEFAESGESEDLLVTEPIKNMAKKFSDSLPNFVSLGAKGSGKTFCYLQLCRFQKWSIFLNKVLYSESNNYVGGFIFPLSQSKNLRPSAKQLIDDSRKILADTLKIPDTFRASEFSDNIESALKKDGWGKKEWVEFWISELANAVGLAKKNPSLSDINKYLISKSTKAVFLFDGIEDILTEIAYNANQQVALKALIDLPNRISELREPFIGVIIFLRLDFLRYTVTQNRAQFEALYKSFSLSWGPESFIQLIYWICSQAHIYDFDADKIGTMHQHQILYALEKVWGKKLGRDNSREAHTARWVFAALTDFNGRLQARDIVRILLNAAKITLDDPSSVSLDLWKDSRLLPPAAIRRSLTPCSKSKIDEAKEETPAFKKWADRIVSDFPGQRTIPFTPDQFDMDSQTTNMLLEMGIIFEDRDTNTGTIRYYMPEIFRTGLDFTLEKGARPRVLVLKRKAMGKDLF